MPSPGLCERTFLEFGNLPQAQNTVSPTQCIGRCLRSFDRALTCLSMDELDVWNRAMSKEGILRAVPGPAAVAFMDLHPRRGEEGHGECGKDFQCLLPLTNSDG